ncbi:TRAP transporter substrate-binding protein DctP [Salinicola avicenniae]|uniref:TRAP transporter substrate-binding protein DctP n=1 Tax=Salinicola avicenniae TaxID=2916836 RepID=UPI0020742B93|nr:MULTISPECIES: TRAP transporter substrate-binding protein DctP [unclassified Salinicola]
MPTTTFRDTRPFTFLTSGLAAVVFAAGTTLLSGEVHAAQTLTYATNTSPTGLRGEAEQGFIDALASVSGGELKVVPYWGASVLKGDETLGGVKNGVADMGFINLNYYPNQLLLNGAFQLFPEGPGSYAGKMQAYHDIYDQVPALREEFSRQGQKIVYLYPYLPYAGVFNEPVTSFEDFEGLRIRASSQWVLNLLGGLGATPVSVPWSDTYQSLQSGAIDGVFTNYDSLSRTGMDEVAPNILTTQRLWVASPMVITLNQQKWASLSEQEKAWFQEAAAKAEQTFGDYYANEFDRISTQQQDAGYTVTAASEEDIERFASLPAVDDNRRIWIESAEEAGADHPGDIIEQMQTIIDASSEVNSEASGS